MEKRCSNCNKIIIKDYLDFLRTTKEKYLQCPYCEKIFPIELKGGYENGL